MASKGARAVTTRDETGIDDIFVDFVDPATDVGRALELLQERLELTR